MSLDAELIDDRNGNRVGSWNYTHNTNRMANLVLHPNAAPAPSVFEEVFFPAQTPWWRLLDGSTGTTGAELLDRIVSGLRNDPDRFRALNPDNGWGNYDQFVALLEQMRDAVPTDAPTHWIAVG